MKNKQEISTHPTINELAESIGEFIAYWGFSKIDGKIWTFIYLNNAAVATPQIIEFLGKSKASVSLSISRLLDYGVIEKSKTGPAGIQTYVTSPNIAKAIFSVLRNRELKLIAQAKEAVDMLMITRKPDIKMDHLSTEKIVLLKDMIHQSHQVLKIILSMDQETISDWNDLLKNYLAASDA